MAFELSDRVLFGLLAAEDRELRSLMTAFSRIAEDPLGSCQATHFDLKGRVVHAAVIGRFWLSYRVNDSGSVLFTELLETG